MEEMILKWAKPAQKPFLLSSVVIEENVMSEGVRIMQLSNGVLETSEKATWQEILAIRKKRKAVLWLDICGQPPEETEVLFTNAFDFHPLAIEDALEERHAPKVNDWKNYLYLVLQAIDPAAPDMAIELDIFIGRNYLVTYSGRSIPALQRSWAITRDAPAILASGPAGVLHGLIGDVADDFLILSDRLVEDLDRLEDELFENPAPRLLEEIFDLKRLRLNISRFLGPQRDVLVRIGRGDFSIIPDQERVYFRDVSDHFERLNALNESQLQLVIAARDTYLSVVNNRLNDVMKILTVITSFFMPLSFLTGFFGMNFFEPGKGLGIWTGNAAFLLVFILMAALPPGMYILMKRRKWF